MSFQIPFGVKIPNPLPVDAYYYNDVDTPYIDTTEVGLTIPSSVIYEGLTVNVAGVEYWYKDGINLIEKIPETTSDPRLDTLYTTIGLSDLTAAEVNQLENINAVLITNDQWAYLGNMGGQPLESVSLELSDLTDVNTSTPTAGNVLVADGVDWESTTLSHSQLSGIGSSDHHVRYALTEDLSSGEITQLENIDSTTISGTQWGYLGDLNQPLTQASSPTFANVTSSNNATANSHLVRLDQVNALVSGLDWQQSAISFHAFTTPPATPTAGDRHISTTTDTTYTTDYIYEWDGAAWVETIPTTGFTLWVTDEDINYTYNGSEWVEFGSTATHNNTSGLQGGATSQYYHLTLSEYTNLVSYAVDNQIPYTNAAADDFDYTSGFTFDGTTLTAPTITDGTFSVTGGTITGASMTASQVSDFDAEVTNNTTVVANTDARHAAVTLGTANGLSLSTQELSLATADATTTGALSAADWVTFNAGSGVTTGLTDGYLPYYNSSTTSLADSNISTATTVTTVDGTLIVDSGKGDGIYLGNGSGQNDDGTDNHNIGVGQNALNSITSGIGAIGIGHQALFSNTANYNIGIGYEAAYNSTTGQYGIGLGYQALYSNTTGSSNTALGYQALYSNTTGSGNIALGYLAGRYISDGTTANILSTNSLYLGANTEANASGETNQIVIGYNAEGSGSNTVTLGNDSITGTYLKGAVNIASLAGTGVRMVTAAADGTLSDGAVSDPIDFGTAQYQIPYTNVSSDDFDYSSDFTFDETVLYLGKPIEASEGIYGFKGTANGASANQWQKILSFDYTTYTTQTFALKICSGGASTIDTINTDVHIGFKNQGGVLQFYANIVNYGVYPILDTEFEAYLDETDATSGTVTLYFKLTRIYQAPTYTITGARSLSVTWSGTNIGTALTGETNDTWDSKDISVYETEQSVSVSPTPADSQIAVWVDDSTLEGTSALTYDGATLIAKRASNFSEIRAERTTSSTSAITLRAGSNATTLYSRQSSTLNGARAFNVVIGTTTALTFSTDSTAEFFNDVTATDFVLASDPKLKNVSDEKVKGIETIMQLKPVYYTWKDGHDEFEHIGFLTTDVEEVRPELVKHGTEYDGLSYSRITAINTAAIQDLKNEIEELKLEIKRLKDGSS